MIDDDAIDLIGDILERICDSLEILEHLASDGELKRIGPRRLECMLESRRVNVICRTLETDKLTSQLVQPGAV
jgi:hypothetical protein